MLPQILFEHGFAFAHKPNTSVCQCVNFSLLPYEIDFSINMLVLILLR